MPVGVTIDFNSLEAGNQLDCRNRAVPGVRWMDLANLVVGRSIWGLGLDVACSPPHSPLLNGKGEIDLRVQSTASIRPAGGVAR